MPFDLKLFADGAEKASKDEAFLKILGIVGKIQGFLFGKQDAIKEMQFGIAYPYLKHFAWIEVNKIQKGKKAQINVGVVNKMFKRIKDDYDIWKDQKHGEHISIIISEAVNQVVLDTFPGSQLGNINVNAVNNNKGMNRDEFCNRLFNNADVYSAAGMSSQQNPEYGMVLFAQSVLETGNFKSGAFVQANNLFGMHRAFKRTRFWSGLYGGEDNNVAAYTSLADSMADRLNWDVYNSIVYVNAGDYMDMVLGGNRNRLKYATDPKYKDKWVACINQVFDNAGMRRPLIKGYSKGTFDPGTKQAPPPDEGGTNANIKNQTEKEWVEKIPGGRTGLYVLGGFIIIGFIFGIVGKK